MIPRFSSSQNGIYTLALLVSAVTLGFAAGIAPVAGVLAIGMIGMLHVMGKPMQIPLAAILAGGLFIAPAARETLAYYVMLGFSFGAVLLPRRFMPLTLRSPRWVWALVLVICAAGLCGLFLIDPRNLAVIVLMVLTCSCQFVIGANIACNLAVTDARMLAWGAPGLTPVSRDLLLGRVTSGMLHDLAQPLNVISMANGNMSHVIERLDIPASERQQLLERVSRIAAQAQGASHILGQFRSFGRNVGPEGSPQTVRAALDRAVEVSRSNVRHNGVDVALMGNALEYALPERNGALQMIAVSALLNCFETMGALPDKGRTGKIVISASLSPAHIVIAIGCSDCNGAPIKTSQVDHATLWFIEQVANEAKGSYRRNVRRGQAYCAVIRLGRDDI